MDSVPILSDSLVERATVRRWWWMFWGSAMPFPVSLKRPCVGGDFSVSGWGTLSWCCFWFLKWGQKHPQWQRSLPLKGNLRDFEFGQWTSTSDLGFLSILAISRPTLTYGLFSSILSTKYYCPSFLCLLASLETSLGWFEWSVPYKSWTFGRISRCSLAAGSMSQGARFKVSKVSSPCFLLVVWDMSSQLLLQYCGFFYYFIKKWRSGVRY